MTITIEVKQTKSGFLISGEIDGKPVGPDVAGSKRQVGLRVKELIDAAFEAVK